MQFYGGEIRGLIGAISFESLNFILDLLDEYIELKEQMMENPEKKK